MSSPAAMVCSTVFRVGAELTHETPAVTLKPILIGGYVDSDELRCDGQRRKMRLPETLPASASRG